MANDDLPLTLGDVVECCRLKGQPVPLRNAPVNWPTELCFMSNGVMSDNILQGRHILIVGTTLGDNFYALPNSVKVDSVVVF